MSASFRSKSGLKASRAMKNALKRYDDSVEDQLRDAIKEGSVFLEGETKKRISYIKSTQGRLIDTGRLLNSITHEVIKRSSKILGRIGTNLFYAVFQEKGTSKMKPTPFLRPTFILNYREVEKNIVKAMNKAARKAGK